ncbi:MAG: hypothetical protein ACRDI2_20345, partial [Chloroflexota bacterium]
VAARGLGDTVDVVPVTCLGECTVGPFLRAATARDAELAEAAAFREGSIDRARRYAEDEGEELDDESELVLSRFAALIQPPEVGRLVDQLAVELQAGSQASRAGGEDGEASGKERA